MNKLKVKKHFLGGLVSALAPLIRESAAILRAKQTGGNEDIARELMNLYKEGYFGDIPIEKAVDGIEGRLTRTARNKSKLKQEKSSKIEVKKEKEKEKDINGLKLMQVLQSKQAENIAKEAAKLNMLNPVPTFIPGTGAKGHDNYYGNKSDEEIKKEFEGYLELALKVDTSKFSSGTLKKYNDTIKYYKKIINNPSLAKKRGGSWSFGCIYNNTSYIADAANNSNLAKQLNSSLVEQIKAEGNSGKCGYVIVTDGSSKIGDLISLGGPTSAHHNLVMVGPNTYYQQEAGTIGIGDKTTRDASVLRAIGRSGYNGNGYHNPVEGNSFIGGVEAVGDWLGRRLFGSEIQNRISDYENMTRTTEQGKGQGYYRIRYVGTPAERARWSKENI